MPRFSSAPLRETGPGCRNLRARQGAAPARAERRHTSSRRSRRGCGRRGSRPRPARTCRPMLRGRRCSLRTSSLAAAIRCDHSREGPARSHTNPVATHRRETGTTRRRPSSREAGTAWTPPGRPTSAGDAKARATRRDATSRPSNAGSVNAASEMHHFLRHIASPSCQPVR